MDLFAKIGQKTDKSMPLAARMRPQNLSEYIGQKHILAQDKLLLREIQADRLSSVLFYGPPGIGKTSLGEVIANQTKKRFVYLNAVTSNATELRQKIDDARFERQSYQKQTILFIDEVHRFNRSQQDILLPHVEHGTFCFMGATTHNPFFSINATLLSRSQIFELKPLSPQEMILILKQALQNKERGLGQYPIIADDEALSHLAHISDGDARKALNALEIGILTTPKNHEGKIHFTLQAAEESIQKKQILYDKNEDGHYDTASAFIKSLRGSDPDAAIYWLAKMLYAGEDPRFIARRLVIAASEDVGNADPRALLIAEAAWRAVESIGMPEARINLAQAVTYIATAPKSNASLQAIDRATEEIQSGGATLKVPNTLKDTHYSGANKLGHGQGYLYPHDYDGHVIQQEYLEEKRSFYEPSNQGYEGIIQKRLEEWTKKKEKNKSAK